MLARTSVAAALAALFLLCAPFGASAHHAPKGAAGHVAEDSVIHSRAEETLLQRHTASATRADAALAAAAVAGNEHQVGQWGPVVNWPLVGIHVALLPNGKVLAYDSVGDAATEAFPVHDHTRATVWDPVTGAHTSVRVNTGFNVFCSGLAHLANGSVFLAGGNKNAALNGIRQTHVFNPSTNTWSLGPNMVYERWYPSVTPLSDGEMLITEGGPDTPEVRTTGGGLRTLTSAALDLPLYPWLDVAPNGRVFYSGPSTTMRSLNPAGNGSWQTHGARDSIDRGYGSHAVYDVGKILVAGGGGSTRDSRVIDLNGATPQVSATAPMASGRRQHNLTVLADGSVLATGGNSSGASLVDLNNGVYAAELWNPATGQWSTLSAMQVTRQYHSTALLLPDGRVLSAGGGICGTCDAVGYLAKNAQVFTPPYLFKKDGSGTLAPRPTIASAPSVASHGASLAISTPNAASIRKVGLVRLGAVTHSVDMEQRYIPLGFTAGTGSVNATVPASANVVPPGPYMLFITDADGVPSVARMVTVSVGNPPPSVGLTQPANGATFTAPATVALAATASDSNGSVSRVEFFNGSTKLGQDTTSPYTFSWAGVGAGTHSLTARAVDNAGAATTSAARTITVHPATIFSDDFEAARGWTPNAAGTDTATAGRFERGNPSFTSSSGAKQLGTTVSGVNDLVTGRLAGTSAGAHDVDGGVTSIRSPPIALTGGSTFRLVFSSYFAHASNSSSADFLRVRVTGSTTQTVYERRGAATDRDAAWSAQTVSLNAFAGQTVRIVIEAADASGANLVEAAVDDLRVTR